MSIADLTEQDLNYFDDTAPRQLAYTRVLNPRKEMHWPKLAIADEYPVTDRDGKVLRYAKVKGAEGLI